MMLQERGTRRSVLKAGAFALAGGVIAGPRLVRAQATPEAAGETLVIYSGQHEDFAVALAEAFTVETGVPVEVRAGDDADLANQIIEEGDATNAGLFLTEDPGSAALLDSLGLLAPIDPESLAKIRPGYNPESGNWLGYSGRARAILYNPGLIAEDELPKTYAALADPEWTGKFGYAPSGAFVGVVTYMFNTSGEEETLAWLQGLKETGTNLVANGAVRDAVEAGQIPFGISNHYYWYTLAEEAGGADKLKSRIHFMGGKDPGALVFSAAAAIPAASTTQEAAQRFVNWLADPEGGQLVVASASPQFPLAPGVASRYDLPSLDDLDPPVFDQGSLSDNADAARLIVEAGIV